MLFELMLVPHELVQVAVYVPAPTWIGFCVLLLCAQVIVPTQPVAVNVACCVPQILVAFEEITGALGAVPLCICRLLELMLVPQLLVQVAV